MAQITCPFNLHRHPRPAGPPIPSDTRTFILNVLAELLNDLRDVQNTLAENGTAAIRVDAAITLLDIIATRLKASEGSVEVKMPVIILNIDIDTQIASVYEWLADLLVKSQAVFVAPHLTIERFVARLHKAAASARKEGNFLVEEKTQKLSLHGEEAQTHGNNSNPTPRPCSDVKDTISEKRMGTLPVREHKATDNNATPSSRCLPQPNSSSRSSSKKDNGRRSVHFDENTGAENPPKPSLRERIATSRLAAEERYFRRRNPFLIPSAEDELDSESPPGSEIMDESCFEDASLADVPPVMEVMDKHQAADKSPAADEDIWSFASHVPKKLIEKDNRADQAALKRLHEQAEERRKQIADGLRAAHELRVASGLEDIWGWVNGADIKQPTSKDLIDDNSSPKEPDSRESNIKEHPADVVDPAFRTAGASICSNAARAESVQRQVENMNQRSQNTELPMPPVDFPGSTEHENALIQQLKNDASSRNDDTSTADHPGDSTVAQGAKPVVHAGTPYLPFSPPTHDFTSTEHHKHRSIDEVLANDAELQRTVHPIDGSVTSSAPAMPHTGDSSATYGQREAHVRSTEPDSDYDGQNGRDSSRRSSYVGQRRCSPWRRSVADAVAGPGGGWSRRSSWTGEGYVFTS